MEIITRREAKERGLDRYYTGKPCKYGHVDERYVSTANCVTCREHRKEYDKKYRETNKEYIKEYDKKYHEDNKEYRNAFNKKWKAENEEHIKEYSKKYNEENKEHRNEYFRNRYATDENYRMGKLYRNMVYRVLKATSSTKTLSTYDLLGYGNEELVQNIGSKFTDGMSWENQNKWHIDHKYPVSRYLKDGIKDPVTINALDNMIPMWAEHNKEKGDMTLEEYLEVRSDLMDVYGRFL